MTNIPTSFSTFSTFNILVLVPKIRCTSAHKHTYTYIQCISWQIKFYWATVRVWVNGWVNTYYIVCVLCDTLLFHFHSQALSNFKKLNVELLCVYVECLSSECYAPSIESMNMTQKNEIHMSENALFVTSKKIFFFRNRRYFAFSSLQFCP